jgi:hypothetical protein
MESAERVTALRFDQDGCELPERIGINAQALRANVVTDEFGTLPYVLIENRKGGLLVVPWHGRLEIFAEEQ